MTELQESRRPPDRSDCVNRCSTTDKRTSTIPGPHQQRHLRLATVADGDGALDHSHTRSGWHCTYTNTDGTQKVSAGCGLESHGPAARVLPTLRAASLCPKRLFPIVVAAQQLPDEQRHREYELDKPNLQSAAAAGRRFSSAKHGPTRSASCSHPATSSDSTITATSAA